MDFLRVNHVPVVNLDCDGPPDHVWEQLLAIGRLVRPATTIHKDDLSLLSNFPANANNLPNNDVNGDDDIGSSSSSSSSK